MRGDAAEQWLGHAADRLRQELKLFARTFSAFLLHPARAAQQWQQGERTFMNPLGFAATAAATYWLWNALLALLWPVAGATAEPGPVQEILSALAPYVHYGLIGITMHFALRVLRSERRLVGSLGAAFLTGGSIGTVTAILLSAAARWFAHTRGTNQLQIQRGDEIALLLFIVATLGYVVVYLATGRALMALHRAAGWKVLLAGAFAFLITAFLFGVVLPEGNYGWHPYITVDRDEGTGFSFGFEG